MKPCMNISTFSIYQSVSLSKIKLKIRNL